MWERISERTSTGSRELQLSSCGSQMAACDSASWTALVAGRCGHDSCRMAHHHLTAHSHNQEHVLIVP